MAKDIEEEEPKVARRTFDLPFKSDKLLRAMAKKEGKSDVALLADAINAYAIRGGLSDKERQDEIKRAVLAALDEKLAADEAKIAEAQRAKPKKSKVLRSA